MAYATALGRTQEATVHLVHVPVLPPNLMMDLSYSPGPNDLPRVRQEAERSLEENAQAVEKRGVRCNTAIVDPPIAPGVAGYADRHSIDLVVLGSQQSGRFATLVFGSTSDRLLRSLRQPVIVLPRTGARPTDSVVVPYESSTSSDRSIMLAGAARGEGPGELHLVCRVDDRTRPESRSAFLDDLYAKVMHLTNFERASIRLHFVGCDPVAAARDVAREVRAGLICVGNDRTHGDRFRRVIRHLLTSTEFPVLLTKSDA